MQNFPASSDRGLLGMGVFKVIKVPSQSSVDETIFLFLRGGLESVEELDSKSNVEASRIEFFGAEAAAIENFHKLDCFGLPFPLNIHSLPAVGGFQPVKPSSCFHGRVILLWPAPEAHAKISGGVVKATDTFPTRDRKAWSGGVISALQTAVLAALGQVGLGRHIKRLDWRSVLFRWSRTSLVRRCGRENTSVFLQEVVIAHRMGSGHYGRDR